MTQPMYYPGLEGVIAGETAVSSLDDGLRYRGYPVEELATHARFEEVAYLLLHGELPKPTALTAFCQRLGHAAILPDELIRILGDLPASAHTMDVMRSGTSLLAHWDNDTAHNDQSANLRKAERLLVQLPLVLATFHRQRHHHNVVAYRPELSLPQNILWTLNGTMPSDTAARALEVSMIMYAEHELNASAFTARVVSSTMSDLHAAITAAIGALKGPLHGGANERVLAVLEEVRSPDQAADWVRNALARKVRIMGFGHRVYKQGDPRAQYLAKQCRRLATTPEYQALESKAEVIEQIVLEEKGLRPNVDWPSARLYHYLGLPVDLFTPLFVVSRQAGWCAHMMEQAANNRIIRPRARYIGAAPRVWVPLPDR